MKMIPQVKKKFPTESCHFPLRVIPSPVKERNIVQKAGFCSTKASFFLYSNADKYSIRNQKEHSWFILVEVMTETMTKQYSSAGGCDQ
jgi:hypothetical protein